MDLENKKLINCGNEFYPAFFDKLCSALEEGQTAEVYVDCIGHTRNNLVQEVYKEKLLEKYGNTLSIQRCAGAYSTTYCYCLNVEKGREA